MEALRSHLSVKRTRRSGRRPFRLLSRRAPPALCLLCPGGGSPPPAFSPHLAFSTREQPPFFHLSLVFWFSGCFFCCCFLGFFFFCFGFCFFFCPSGSRFKKLFKFPPLPCRTPIGDCYAKVVFCLVFPPFNCVFKFYKSCLASRTYFKFRKGEARAFLLSLPQPVVQGLGKRLAVLHHA